MSLVQKLTGLWAKIAKPAPSAPPAPFTYGVVIRSGVRTDGITDRVFVAAATPVAEKVVEVLKAQGLKDEAVEVTIGALSTVENHQGVRFGGTAKTAQAVADALPNHIVIRSDCRVLCPQSSNSKKPHCEID